MDSSLMNNSEKDLPNLPENYIMMALRGLVIMPYMQMTIDVAREKSLTAVNRAVKKNENLFLVSQKHHSVEVPGPKDIFRVGCVCQIRQVIKLPNDLTRVLVEGVERRKIASYTAINPCFEVVTEPLLDRVEDETTLIAYKKMILEALGNFDFIDTKVSPEVIKRIKESELNEVCYLLAQVLFDTVEERVAFLQMDSLSGRAERILIGIGNIKNIMAIEKKISHKVHLAMDKSQKEYYLREKAKAIHEELGDDLDELDELETKAKELPEGIAAKALKEIGRMRNMNRTSPEAGVARSYVEWLLDVPWKETTEDNSDLKVAKDILDADHFGMEKVKQRILEYIAVMTLTKKIKGPILCFSGPPGVGKTSIARSIARALGRKFVTVSLGGIKDEAEIRGHRRTYIGAIPGGIIYHMKQAGTVNPVFLLDEIDKMSSDYHGDPASAMLEVLDPEQNNHFTDHYLEVPYDLSKVMFVTTANSLDTIPAPLLDRMEVIELSGYTEDEKVSIAERYLIDKQCVACGLKEGQVEISEDAVREIISGYTRESGVRNLERSLGSVCRKIACKIVEGDKSEKFFVKKENVADLLGANKFTNDELEKHDRVGEATGLAWTSVGGTTLPIEVALIEGGKGDIILTGKLGDVMKESARTAISVVRTHAAEYGIDPKAFETVDIHLHAPEGAVPKDGPSAGITIATAVLSAFSNRPVDHLVAMTGEITLRGKVLPIGGLKEKVLAAARLGIKTIIIPSRNQKDLDEIPDNIKSGLNIIPVEEVADVFRVAVKAKAQAAS